MVHIQMGYMAELKVMGTALFSALRIGILEKISCLVSFHSH